jgi:hypothetical protein
MGFRDGLFLREELLEARRGCRGAKQRERSEWSQFIDEPSQELGEYAPMHRPLKVRGPEIDSGTCLVAVQSEFGEILTRILVRHLG